MDQVSAPGPSSIRQKLEAIADDESALAPLPSLRQVIFENADIIAGFRSRGLRWSQIAALLAQAGAPQPEGGIRPGTLRKYFLEVRRGAGHAVTAAGPDAPPKSSQTLPTSLPAAPLKPQARPDETQLNPQPNQASEPKQNAPCNSAKSGTAHSFLNAVKDDDRKTRDATGKSKASKKRQGLEALIDGED